MEIHIGRDPESAKLKLTVGDKSVIYGSADVPMSVLANHCLLSIDDKKFCLKNVDINAYTYVNGHPIEKKTIALHDTIMLGKDKYLLDWKAISSLLPVDIRSLQDVWNKYESQNVSLQIVERKFNALRSATGIVTMVAIALSIATGGRSLWYMLLYVVAIVISLLFFIKAYLDSSKIPQKRQDLTRQFQHDYVCPCCGHFLGNQSYEILAQNDRCPYCKAKFIH